MCAKLVLQKPHRNQACEVSFRVNVNVNIIEKFIEVKKFKIKLKKLNIFTDYTLHKILISHLVGWLVIGSVFVKVS